MPVTLDGSKSSDADKDSLTYQWAMTTRPAGSSATLTPATSAKPSFTADVAGVYVASLVVNDGKINSNVATVTITASVANAAPVANAGTAQNVMAGSTVTLDGSASFDANNDPLTYTWTLASRPVGSTITLTAPNTVRPSFKADVAGDYAATLLVNDGRLSSAPSSVTTTASVANAAPVANAGIPQNVLVGTMVTLDGSASSDANQDTLTYRWSLTSKPASSAAVLNAPTSERPSFTADIAGTYVASLTVNDGKLDGAATTVIVTASVANAAPIAMPFVPVGQSVVKAGATVTLYCRGSDADNDPLACQWTLTSKPTNSAAALSSTTATEPTFTADVGGDYVATLVVNDGKVNSAPVSVTVQAKNPSSVSLFTSYISMLPEAPIYYEQPLPYTGTANEVTTYRNCRPRPCNIYPHKTLRLVANGQSFTITNVQAINLTTELPITPSFVNLLNNQILSAGEVLDFTMASSFIGEVNSQFYGKRAILQYSFTIKETGETINFMIAVGISQF